ncbi:MAG: RNA 2',3'-cyclic phosphodiesterase [Gemmatimonadota bacterium]|nr:MAG: RNA 2',3'-cyclic phosphodiesterase [Gemmatimonadota bacterium]
MRVFVAINPSTEERVRLNEASRSLREAGFPVRWVPPENVHLTLKFLGEVPEGGRAELVAAVDRAVAGVAAFRLRVQGVGAFPTLRRPNVVWVGIESSAPLKGLQSRLEDELWALGFPKETRAFHPHFTVGRSRRGVSAKEFDGLDSLARQIEYEDVFLVAAVEVMRSRLLPGGAVYDVIHRADLEAGGERLGHA